MSKAYLLVICLFAVSFTGCMSGSDDNTETDTTIDDETKQEDNTEQEEEEEELIDPVGEPIEDSSTDCNCTLIVEDESYDPEYFSSVFLSNQRLDKWVEVNGTWTFFEYSDTNDFTYYTNFRGFFNKTGNNVHITPVPTDIEHSPIYPDYWYKITIYGPDGLYWQDYVIFLYECDRGECTGSDVTYLNEVDIELPWEPVGFTLQWTGLTYLSDISTNGFNQISITRPF